MFFGSREQTGLAAVLQAVAFPTDVDRGRMMQQSIQDRGGDDRRRLREADQRPVPEVAKKHGVSAQTCSCASVAG